MNWLFGYCLMSIMIFPAACKGRAPGTLSTLGQEQTKASTKTADSNPQETSPDFVRSDTLSYEGYEVVKLKKKVEYEYDRGKRKLIEVSYTAMKKNGRVLAEFDGVRYPLGNSNDFGLVSALARETKQLIISQSIPRGGRHWIVDFSPEFRILFDSDYWHVGREDITLIDIDRDGVYEILLEDPSFYMSLPISVAETPLTRIIFKYDALANKYLPANQLHKEYSLSGIEDDIAKLKSKSEIGYLSDRLRILLRYIYAGEQSRGWVFFEREYTLPDKAELENNANAVLKGHPVYKFVYKTGTT